MCRPFAVRTGAVVAVLLGTLALLHCCRASGEDGAMKYRLQVVTVATGKTDGYRRFMDSAERFNLSVKVVGMGKEWQGGDIARYPGGGHKINLLKPVVKKWEDQTDLVVMFTDSYDVVFVDGEAEIIRKFLEFDARAVFSAEGFCWPDQSLAKKYPKVALGKRFLCSGGFIGFADTIAEIISDHPVQDRDDDQLYYTELYLDQEKRAEYAMKLDHRSYIFQNLNGAKEEVELRFEEGKVRGENVIYGTRPSVFHGNGPSKIFLNYLSNYLTHEWREGKCVSCVEQLVAVPQELPTVFMGVFIEQPTPFLQQVLDRLAALNYPKKKMTVFLRNSVEYHDEVARAWLKSHDKEYGKVYYLDPQQSLADDRARVEAVQECVQNGSEYYLSIDSLAMVTNMDMIQHLLKIDKNIVTPLMARPGKMWSNFWGSVASDGFYARSSDYAEIVQRSKLGVWNVPHVSTVYLVKGAWLKRHTPEYSSERFEVDMAFTAWMREKGHFMYVTNLEEFGHLVNPDGYSTEHLNNDMYEIFSNRKDWEDKYLHPDWSGAAQSDTEVEMPCRDVYWFPLMSEAFARELVAEMEHFGQWSGGSHEDARLAGGYENVPTRDIHMNQVGFDEHWLEVIRSYVVPVNGKVYPGYYSKAHSIMNFVVKYSLGGQSSLRPHHDASTYTINVALTQPGVDHWGGGCRFLRYNCSVVDTRIGWALMHPGRLTHYHEGLPLVNGTRYIMVSFIDP